VPFGYVPDYRDSPGLVNRLKDIYLRVFGMPFLGRRIEAHLVFRYVPQVKGLKILDVGCGNGLFVVELAKRGAEVYGVDLSQAALDVAQTRCQRANLRHRVSLIKAPASEMPFLESYFDCAICNSVLEHIPDDLAVLKEINRVLKAGGLLVLTVPTDFEMRDKVPLRLAKALLRLPHGVRLAIGSQELAESKSYAEYCELLCRRYAHARLGYSLKDIERKLGSAGFRMEALTPYGKLFHSICEDLMQTLSAFGAETEEGREFAKHEILHALAFPIFQAISLCDRALPDHAPAQGMAIRAIK
jgi:ubiquinone/menaquinone biosynthesis C-methylase UbiE